ncbi:glycosyltransferase family 2 protein [Ornithinimicrobium cavernae]|uniref:glycosyltransferase family 2 protein n=1 Tax=Ornithinimicrobium cavernae TaxID=2666047 RepID=UPI000D693962|nr:glycosyltransferase family 2 protein [Ornithinimicrobium cavernae]
MSSRSDRPEVSIVSPVFDEEAGLAALVERVVRAVEPVADSFEIVLVDDGSRDGSWAEIERAHARDPRVRGVGLSRNFGKESAIVAGLEAARGDAVIVMDSDLQHPPALLPELVARWRAGAEVVEAVKLDRTGQALGGRLASTLFNRVFERLTGVDLVGASDYRLLSRRAVTALLALPERTTFFRGTSTWIGFPREQVPFRVDPRVTGRSRWGFRALLRLALNGITSFTPAPLHLVTIGAALFAVFAVVLGVQTLVRFLQGDAVTGFTTVILLLLIQGTFILLGLGIVGQYLARIHDEVKNRPRYLVARSSPPDREPDARR